MLIGCDAHMSKIIAAASPAEMPAAALAVGTYSHHVRLKPLHMYDADTMNEASQVVICQHHAAILIQGLDVTQEASVAPDLLQKLLQRLLAASELNWTAV